MSDNILIEIFEELAKVQPYARAVKRGVEGLWNLKSGSPVEH